MQWAKTACRLDPTAYLSLWSLQWALYADGQYAASIEVGDRALGVSGRMPGALVDLAVACAASGDSAAARAVAQELSARAGREPISPLHRAIVAAALGERDEAIAFARAAFANRDPLMVCFGRWITAHALLALPEYQQLLDAMQQPRQEHIADA